MTRHDSQPIGIGALRVLDLAGQPAIYGTKLLADLGADVVRLEPPDGDPLRNAGPFFRDQPGPGRGLTYAFYNTSKRSIALDTSSAEGRAVLRRLVAWADIVIESGAGEHGLRYQDVAALNPRVIWASVTPFGLTGPRTDWQANDLVALAAGGILYLNGFPGDRPLQPPLTQAFHLGGIAAVSGVLVALQQRNQTGQGQQVDVSLQAAVATATENTLGYWDLDHWNRPRLGTRAFNGTTILYQCADGWVAGMAGNRWEDMTRWAEQAGVATGEWYDQNLVTREDRTARMETANRLVQSLFITQPVQEVARRAEEIKIPIQPVNRVSDLFVDPQLAYRGFWVAVPHPDLGAIITYPGAPFQSSSGFWQIRSRAPLPGEHSAAVLSELGYDEATITGLLAHGTVRAWGHTPTERSAGPAVAALELAEPEPRPSAAVTPVNDVPPMAGLRVIDFSQAATGPLVGRILGDYGAQVIKVEWGQKPDPQRFFAPANKGVDTPNVSALFNLVNASKRSLTLNLNNPRGRALLKRLIAISDVILDNYGGDPFPKWGITYDEARAIRPDIIMARSSTVGRTGPRTGLAGLGYGIAAAAGWNALMGFAGEPPVGMGPAYPDYSVNCHHFLISILTALEHRRRTGEGQYIDLSQHESTITWLGPAILDYTANGRIEPPNANRHPDYAPHGVYPAAGDDRWIALAVTPERWDAFTKVAAEDGVRFDPEVFGTHAERKAAEDELDAVIAGWTQAQDPHALAERLQHAGIAASNVARAEDLVSDPQLAAREHYVRLYHPEAGDRLWDRGAFRLANAPGMPRRAPLLGEDNDWVLEELFGLGPEEVAEAYVEAAIN